MPYREKTIEIDKDTELSPGDVVFLHFETASATWIKATECAMVEGAISRREDFQIMSIDYLQEGKVVFEIKVLKTNPVLVTVGIIVAAILAASSLMFFAAGWMFQKAELVVTAPATTALSAGALIVAIILLISFFNKGKVNVG